MLVPADEAAIRAIQEVGGSSFDSPAALIAILFSVEFSIAYAALASVILWRARLRLWPLAPFAFLLLIPVELSLKLIVNQPTTPIQYHRADYVSASVAVRSTEETKERSSSESQAQSRSQDEWKTHLWVRNRSLELELDLRDGYPLISLDVNGGTFPSGHAMRIGFFVTFLAVVLRRHSGGGRRFLFLAPGLAVLGVALGLSRSYLGVHWPSDVTAGLVLGASLGLPLAIRMAEQLEHRKRARLQAEGTEP